MAVYKVAFGKNSKLTSYDGLSVGQRKKLRREAERIAAGRKSAAELRYERLVRDVRRINVWKHLGESNLDP